jgi:hypothetical protein
MSVVVDIPLVEDSTCKSAQLGTRVVVDNSLAVDMSEALGTAVEVVGNKDTSA